jgi:hypothetical protein
MVEKSLSALTYKTLFIETYLAVYGRNALYGWPVYLNVRSQGTYTANWILNHTDSRILRVYTTPMFADKPMLTTKSVMHIY